MLSKSVPLSLSPMAQQKRLRDSLRRERWAKYVTDEALDEMLEQATVRSYPRKNFVLRHGDRGHNFFGLLFGQVRLSIPSSSGDEFILWDLWKGYWFGSTTLIDKAPATFDARALIDSKIIEIPRSAVTKVADNFPEIYKYLFADQALYTRMTQRLMAHMIFHPLKSRLAFRLLVLIEIHGHQAGESAYLEANMSQGDFAKLVNGSRQQVNRIFRQWKNEGLVSLVDGQYHVPSVKKLSMEAESTEP